MLSRRELFKSLAGLALVPVGIAGAIQAREWHWTTFSATEAIVGKCFSSYESHYMVVNGTYYRCPQCDTFKMKTDLIPVGGGKYQLPNLAPDLMAQLERKGTT